MSLIERTPVLADNAADIQVILASGLAELHASSFRLLRVRDRAAAGRWMMQLRGSGNVKSVADLSRQPKFDQAVSVAFSFEGLAQLGLQPSDEFPFPTPFQCGMGCELRERILRDPPRGPKPGWQWNDVAANVTTRSPGETVHLFVAHWWLTGSEPPLVSAPTETAPASSPQAGSGLFSSAFDTVSTVVGSPAYFDSQNRLTEPFGFRDGLSQPILRGLRPENSDKARRNQLEAGKFHNDRLVAPGEFILGYRNEYDQLSYMPEAKQWPGPAAAHEHGGRFGLNGSYLAVRQIEQDVAAFNALKRQTVAGPNGGCPLTLAEKAMGRQFDGKPLTEPLRWVDIGDSKADAFRFRLEDADGLICPRGSHVRRVNPRDALGTDVESGLRASRLHRLLRRGRPYQEDVRGQRKQGLFFIACNADLERQFEFVYQRWLHNPRFAGLEQQDDPVLGAEPDTRRISLPALPVGALEPLGAYTRTVGGGYFFLPGIRALGFIADQAMA